jgi:hypothetical protein
MVPDSSRQLGNYNHISIKTRRRQAIRHTTETTNRKYSDIFYNVYRLPGNFKLHTCG